MTVERVTRFYLGEFQTTLTKGGKYINELDPEEEKALIRYRVQHARLHGYVVVGTTTFGVCFYRIVFAAEVTCKTIFPYTPPT